jgi:Zn-dependent protease/CBS domain-containing protein
MKVIVIDRKSVVRHVHLSKQLPKKVLTILLDSFVEFVGFSWGIELRATPMKAQVKLGRIFGIEIGLHYSWFIIALLITLSLAAEFQALNPLWETGVIWATAIVTGLLFFTTIIVHELSHAAVAKARNLPVRSITLFALGGVAQIEREPNEAGTEFLMGIVGPVASALIGMFCLLVAWTLGWSPLVAPETPLLATLMWLGYINISLAVFNLIPAFPLDGGRVLRGFIWWITGDGVRATRVATRIGQVFAVAFMILGILRFFNGAGLGGLWIAFIGFFLLEAAGASRAQVENGEQWRDVRARDLLERDCPVVDGQDNLRTFVNESLLPTGKQCFLVQNGNKVAGMITPREIKGTDRAQWPYTTVGQAMRPLDQLRAVTPGTPITDVMEIMDQNDISRLPVVRDGRIEGVISRGGVLHFLLTRPAVDV